MIFHPTELPGVLRIDAEPHRDERGSFARTFDAVAFRARGLVGTFVECSIAHNSRPLTLRGMHFQAPPHAEAKLVRCTRGRLWDVALDLRPHSASYLGWAGFELSPVNQVALWIPAGVAHGYLTLEPDTDVLYQTTTPHAPDAARGVRWDDPAFHITWPRPPAVIALRDANFPDFDPTSDMR